MSDSLNKNISFLLSFVIHSILITLFYFVGLHAPQNSNRLIEFSIESGSGGSGSPFIPEEKINLKNLVKDEVIKSEKKIIPAKKLSSEKNQITGGNSTSGTGTGTGSGTGSGSGLNLGLPAPPPKPKEEVYLVAVDEMPEPIGGIQRITSQIILPNEAKRNGIGGTVFVLAFVDENGTVRKTLLTKGIGSGCDEAAMRAVSISRFKPGKQNGSYVKVQVQIPVPIKPY